MRLKENIMDEQQMRRTLIRMSHEIIEKNRGADNLVLIGIKRRGFSIANEIASIIKAVEGKIISVGAADITMYRENSDSKKPVVKSTDIPFSIDGADIIIVDDVLYTGRTVRAALELLAGLGNPRTVQLAVLIDRGNHELPIGANYIGKSISSQQNELVSVNVGEIDGVNKVDLFTF